ncbi:SIMPL domain-containing protein [Glaciibacter superstes]|uniref:SIMPL domain-containing protein n=1 Tax=Glaciibacter superstes TaxID=501023 RepID=UPI0003B7417A|nr:SIMPL domain-containing protein [Glaciibacter superstes]
MNETVITVQGTYSHYQPAERATVSLSVHHESEQRQSAFTATVAAADAVRAQITALHEGVAGHVTWWSSDQVQVWSAKPWNNDGKQLPLVHHSRVTFRVKFKDFDALAQWSESVAAVNGVAISGVVWALTDARKKELIDEVRTRAVQDAVAKASVYGASLGLGPVRAIAVADPGMLGDGGSSESAPQLMTYARSASIPDAGSGPALSFKPEDIEMSATVDVRFVAS